MRPARPSAVLGVRSRLRARACIYAGTQQCVLVMGAHNQGEHSTWSCYRAALRTIGVRLLPKPSIFVFMSTLTAMKAYQTNTHYRLAADMHALHVHVLRTTIVNVSTVAIAPPTTTAKLNKVIKAAGPRCISLQATLFLTLPAMVKQASGSDRSTCWAQTYQRAALLQLCFATAQV